MWFVWVQGSDMARHSEVPPFQVFLSLILLSCVIRTLIAWLLPKSNRVLRGSPPLRSPGRGKKRSLSGAKRSVMPVQGRMFAIQLGSVVGSMLLPTTPRQAITRVVEWGWLRNCGTMGANVMKWHIDKMGLLVVQAWDLLTKPHQLGWFILGLYIYVISWYYWIKARKAGTEAQGAGTITNSSSRRTISILEPRWRRYLP